MSTRTDLSKALVDLQELAERLRRECPWDREQTARSIVPHTVEEAYEVADAALTDDDEKLIDELGDLLFQVYFLSLTLEERDRGTLTEVARRIHDKLVRRHPHVFRTPGELSSPGEVKERWENLKSEQEGREGIFHHVPENLPALLYARKIQRRAATIGFEYADPRGALSDLAEEVSELQHALTGVDSLREREPDPTVAAEVGDLLFACVNTARLLSVDPELELRLASARFVARVQAAERLAGEEGFDFAKLALAEQDRYFDRAKAQLRSTEKDASRDVDDLDE